MSLFTKMPTKPIEQAVCLQHFYGQSEIIFHAKKALIKVKRIKVIRN